jgi:hypothetical protein
MEIESLRRASMAGLREKYREVFQEATRCRHREHLFRATGFGRRTDSARASHDARNYFTQYCCDHHLFHQRPFASTTYKTAFMT